MEQESSVPERTQQTEATVMDQSSIVSEEDEIQRAIAMSLEGKFFIISKPKQYKLFMPYRYTYQENQFSFNLYPPSSRSQTCSKRSTNKSKAIGINF